MSRSTAPILVPGLHGPPGWLGPALHPAARRALTAFALVAGGFVLSRQMAGVGSSAWFGLAAGACAAAIPSRGWMLRIALAAAMVFLAGGWFDARILEQPAGSIGRFLPADNGLTAPIPIEVEGLVLDRPRKHGPRGGVFERFAFTRPGAGFTLGVRRVRTESGFRWLSGRVRVWASAIASDVSAGDRVSVRGLAIAPRGRSNPGEPAFRLWNAQRGIVGSVRVSGPDLIRVLKPGGSVPERMRAWWIGWRRAQRDRAGRLLDEVLPDGVSPGARDLLSALLLGERDPGSETERAFQRLGVGHLLAISGFHLVVLAWMSMMVLRLTGDHGYWEWVLVSAVVIGYLVIVPARAPVLRAAAMVLGLALAQALDRRYDRLTILAWLAIVMLAFRPMDLFAPGFQLSFGLVGVLVWMGPGLSGRLFGSPLRGTVRSGVPRWWSVVARSSRSIGSVSLLMWAVSMPIVLHHFGRISPLGAAMTVVTAPLVGSLLGVGVVAIGLGGILPVGGSVLGLALAWAASWTAGLVGWIDALPGSSVQFPMVSAAWAAAATVVVLYWFGRGYLRDRRAWAGTALVLAWLGGEVWLGTRLPPSEPMRIDTLAVGDGACHLIRSGSDSLLWDCGSLRLGLGRRMIPEAVRALGAWHVRRAVVTHANLDHFSALVDAAEPLGIREVYVGSGLPARGQDRPGGATAVLLEELERRGVEIHLVHAGDRLRIGSAELEFIWPPPGERFDDENDNSLVGLIRVGTRAGERRLLMTGDIRETGIAGVLARDVRADMVEVPHHGSTRVAGQDLLRAVGPSVVIQSTGPRRAGRAFWDSSRRGRAWLTTASDGAGWVRIDRDGSIRYGTVRGGRRGRIDPPGGRP